MNEKSKGISTRAELTKEVGIVVCNYNKKDYVLDCIDSILNSFGNFDVYVVDNASNDGSAEAIKEKYGNIVTVIANKENFGGSGGFNTGLRILLEKGYPYLMCVDNDVRFDKNNVVELLKFLKTHKDVGMVGSKILYMDDPERIQTMGAMIDYKKYHVTDLYRYMADNEDIEDFVFCDYVPACSLMVRTEAVREVGLMPEENYIYYDDMDWGVRFNMKGYKVAGISAAKVWHKGGGRVSTTTFNKYYMFRNRIYFFMKYLDKDKKEPFARYILDELYRSVCACLLKGDDAMAKTFMYAYDDAIHGVRGRAADYKILKREDKKRFETLVKDKSSILILFENDYTGFGSIMDKLKELELYNRCTISVRDCPEEKEKIQKQYPKIPVVIDKKLEKYDLVLKLCSHIFEVSDEFREAVYIDGWQNLLETEEEFQLGRNFQSSKEMFININLPLVLKSNFEGNGYILNDI